jgi:hypothetical protein
MRDILIPKNIKFEKARFGSKSDGGYIFAKTNLIDYKIFGFGVNNDISCEVSLNEYFKGTVDLFDGSCDFNATLPPNFIYNKININKNNINEILKCDKPIILKMDIEGYEYECLSNLNNKILNNLHQIVVEFHLWDGIGYSMDEFYKIILKIQETHKIFHIHGNNNDGIYKDSIPKLLELSFINKKLCDLNDNDNGKYPILNLDFPNNPFKEELHFMWW